VKFNCGPSAEQKVKNLRKEYEERAENAAKWQPFFAWLPIRIGEDECRWLEVVERRVVGGEKWPVGYGSQLYMKNPFSGGGQFFWENYPKIEYRAKEPDAS
jgi:hypothetical protein